MDWALKFQEHALPHLGALCLFMLTTGARISEAVNLRWQDVNLDTREAKIRQTKIGSERIANIPRVALAAIKAIPSNRAPDDRVFKYSDRTCVRQSWKSAVERAGLKYLSPHSCRHGFATKMLQDGIDVKTVAQMGGWKDVATLVRTYAHALNDHRITDSVFDTEVAHNHPKKTASN